MYIVRKIYIKTVLNALIGGKNAENCKSFGDDRDIVMANVGIGWLPNDTQTGVLLSRT